MRSFLLLSFCLLFLGSLQAQKYRTAAGIRVGTEFGLTVQQSLWDNYTLEGIAQKGFFNDMASVSVLFEKHHKLLFKGLNIYMGAGPQAGFYSANKRVVYKGEEPVYRKNAYGLALIGGIEMRVKNMIISYDYKPALNFTGGDRFFDSQTGLSVRYILIKAKKKEQKWKFWKKEERRGRG